MAKEKSEEIKIFEINENKNITSEFVGASILSSVSRQIHSIKCILENKSDLKSITQAFT